MAAATGVSASTIGRIWRSYGLKPHLSTTFKLSNDRRFAEKLEDVVGLYLNPPDHAVVLSCDEKSRFLTQMCARFSPSRSAAPWEEGADALVPANQR